NNYKFTGKERDTESGLDEFGARYYSSSLSRFMIPDWAAKPATVPYANFGNPQSLNLYGYVENNPTTTGDPDGHQEGAALNLDRDVNDLAAGRISEKEYMDRQKARGVGAMAGLSLVGAALAAPEAGIIVRNLIAVGLATAPRTVPIITDAIEGYVNPGSPGT